MPKTQPDSLNYQKRQYEVMEYNPAWAENYLLLSGQMAQVFEECQPDLYHVGGTAVPGLPSQATLDMLVVVPDIYCIEHHLDELRRFKYEIHHNYTQDESIFAIKHRDGIRLENIHVLPAGHPGIDKAISFRNYFIEHPEDAKVYGDMKLELYDSYKNDYASYKKEKDTWLNSFYKKKISPWWNA